MATTIEFSYKGEDYVLEYSRRAIVRMEKEGFSFTRAEDSPFTLMSALFRYAFYKNHRRTFDNVELVEEMQGLFTDKEDLYATLSDMVNETVSMLSENPSDTKNAIKWKKV